MLEVFRVNRAFKYFIAVFFVFAFLAMGFALFKAWGSLKDMTGRVSDLEESLKSSDNACLELHQRIYELENNPWAVERTARERCHLCKKGEFIFIYDEDAGVDSGGGAGGFSSE